MKEIVCKTENKHKYRILIQKGLREDLGKMPEIFDDHAKIVIITDKNVGKYYLASVKSSFAITAERFMRSSSKRAKRRNVYLKLRRYTSDFRSSILRARI